MPCHGRKGAPNQVITPPAGARDTGLREGHDCVLVSWRLFLSPAKTAARETLARYPSCFRILPFHACAARQKSPIGDLHDYSPWACPPGLTARKGGQDFPVNITHTKTPDIHLHWAWLHDFPFRRPGHGTDTPTPTPTLAHTQASWTSVCVAWPAPGLACPRPGLLNIIIPSWPMTWLLISRLFSVAFLRPFLLPLGPSIQSAALSPRTRPQRYIDLSVLLLAPAMSSFAPSRHGDLCRASPDTVEHGRHQISVKKG